jgi:hypothetical protein
MIMGIKNTTSTASTVTTTPNDLNHLSGEEIDFSLRITLTIIIK